MQQNTQGISLSLAIKVILFRELNWKLESCEKGDPPRNKGDEPEARRAWDFARDSIYIESTSDQVRLPA